VSALDPCLAVIPARGGSKGLPGKNIRPLAGLPLLVHSLRCAAMAPRIAKVIVSTDSETIAAAARQHGGDVPFLRPAELAKDDTPMMPVLQHALSEVERIEQKRFGSVLLLDPTSPGRLPEDISKAFEILDADADADGVIACSQPRFNPFWVGVVEKSGYMSPAFEPKQEFSRRQDVPRFLRINGALYLWRRDHIVRGADAWWRGRHRALEIPEMRAFSIDDQEEFEMAAMLIERNLVSLPWMGKKS
jgi:N-acylneuraminate cytidylyltransferase